MVAPAPAVATKPLGNAEIADRLLSLAQLLAARGENAFKIKAYRRAAEMIKSLSESIDERVRSGADLTTYPGIGQGIGAAITEIVQSGSLGQLETLRAEAGPQLAALSEHPRLDPKRVLHAYEKLSIASIAELKTALASGAVAKKLGQRAAQHFQSALAESRLMLLSEGDEAAEDLARFLETCGASRVEVVGEVRRRVEVIGELAFLVATEDFPVLVEKFEAHGGRAEVLSRDRARATFRLSSGVLVTLASAPVSHWGLALVAATGSDAHLESLAAAGHDLGALARSRKPFRTEPSVYREFGLGFIPPELRGGLDELARAARGPAVPLVEVGDICGDLHAHSTSSDGEGSIEEMVEGARARGYSYLGITDHSQSLKIAGGVSEEALWQQIRAIDKLNARLRRFRVLKSAEVDILEDGSLDYPDTLLRELDYTVCSIHSRFSLNRAQQTGRLLRAMDNPYFTILGHATGRKLLRRPGYEIDVGQVVSHAKACGCFIEINANPNRLDLSAENARLAREAGVKIAICTDAHSLLELDNIQFGVSQARRARLERADILNTMPWSELGALFAARRK